MFARRPPAKRRAEQCHKEPKIVNIALLLTVVIGVALAGFIVKYDRQLFGAVARAGRGAYRKKRTIIALVVGLAVLGGASTAGYYAAWAQAREWENDFRWACYRRQAEMNGREYREGYYMPSNMDINNCHGEWSKKPWYTRAGLLRPAEETRNHR